MRCAELCLRPFRACRASVISHERRKARGLLRQAFMINPSTSARAIALSIMVLVSGMAGCAAEVVGGAGLGGGGAGGESGEGGTTDEPVCEEGEQRSCGPDQGIQYCFVDDHDIAGWSDCFADGAVSSTTTPLVLSFDGGAVAMSEAPGLPFALTATSQCVGTDWPTAATPWLAIDRDGDGRVTSGAELFGSAVPLETGVLADNGFQALAELDSDKDGRITAHDVRFSELMVWSDRDANRLSDATELEHLAARGIVSIDLSYGSDRRCDVRGNCEIERASFRFTDGTGLERTGAVIDVHLVLR